MKYEGKVLGGSVRDLDWDEEGKRVIVVGDGRERFGVAFFVDGGSRCVRCGSGGWSFLQVELIEKPRAG